MTETVSAVTKSRLANYLASGNTSAAMNLLRGISVGAGIEAGEQAQPQPSNGVATAVAERQ